MLAVRVAQRVNDCLVIVGNEVEGCFASIETMYTDMLREYNAAQKDGDAVQYQPLVFDIDPKERCELCFHASAAGDSRGEEVPSRVCQHVDYLR